MVKVKEDLTGRRFGSWTVIQQVEDYIYPSNGQHRAQWLCQCDCGKQRYILETNLKGHKSTSCGCRARTTILGKGVCDLEIYADEKTCHAYQLWSNIINRCYNQTIKEKYPSYQNCCVCEEWLLFSNFKQWFDEEKQWYHGESRLEVDKDILQKGNKLYSPDTCVVVPHAINAIFIKRDAARGPYPIGVNLYKPNGKFRAALGAHGNRKHIGYYDTPEEAFQAYKKAKEQHIKDVADEYKAKYPDFPQRLYDAMYAYEVEITD